MWLLLCTSDDIPALWAARRLRARGIQPLVVLTPELLHYSSAWEHRLHPEGRFATTITLADRRRVEGEAIRGVLNRIAFVPSHLVERLVDGDRPYALQEWTALHMSWLSSLRVPVLNLPVIDGLCGAWRHPSEWTWLASQAGLECDIYEQGVPASGGLLPAGALLPRAPAVHTVIAVDGQGVDGHVSPEVADACGRLGALAKTRVLGVDLDARTGAFLGASPRPDLRIAGEAGIDALASALRGAGAG